MHRGQAIYPAGSDVQTGRCSVSSEAATISHRSRYTAPRRRCAGAKRGRARLLSKPKSDFGSHSPTDTTRPSHTFFPDLTTNLLARIVTAPPDKPLSNFSK